LNKKELIILRNWKKTFKVTAIIAVCIFLFIIFITLADESRQQYLNSINYDVTLNEDGSATIVETWNIYVLRTNTLFKKFGMYGFGEVKDVSVKDISKNTMLNQINKEMYHVTTGSFYALPIDNNMFEIAWGTGLEKAGRLKKYEIKYTLTDVVSRYKDCDEFYWKFFDVQNEIYVKKLTGTIKLPSNVTSLDDLLVWGHGEFNGKIEKDSNNIVKFKGNDIYPGRMVEVRVVTKDRKIFNTAYNSNEEKLSSILENENLWAQETNKKVEEARIFLLNIELFVFVILLIRIIFVKIAIKKSREKYEHLNLDYYREIPRDGLSTPIEAAVMKHCAKSVIKFDKNQGNMISATILDLCLKGYIKLKPISEVSVEVEITDKDTSNMQRDESIIYKMLNKIASKTKKCRISDLTNYAKKHYQEFADCIYSMTGAAEKSLVNQGLIDARRNRIARRYAYGSDISNISSIYYIIISAIMIITNLMILVSVPIISAFSYMAIGFSNTFLYFTYLIVLLPVIVELIILDQLLQTNDLRHIISYTQEGIYEQEKWNGLEKYLVDFSTMEMKELPELILFEKYMVYATAFGIADEVIKQLISKYPYVSTEEFWTIENKENYPILSNTFNPYFYGRHSSNYISSSFIGSIQSNTIKAYKESVAERAAHYSSSGGGGSGFGGGGGFSGGGGGGRRWRWPEWAEDK
jgi:uncharacterized membrane protein